MIIILSILVIILAAILIFVNTKVNDQKLSNKFAEIKNNYVQEYVHVALFYRQLKSRKKRFKSYLREYEHIPDVHISFKKELIKNNQIMRDTRKIISFYYKLYNGRKK
jgi:C-terminal processing protease CtpA/Prc